MLFLVSRSPPECAENRRRPLNRVTLREPVWFPMDVQMLPGMRPATAPQARVKSVVYKPNG
jgi:hypothetical protein